MKSKFNMLYENVMKSLLREDASFKFSENEKCGPTNICVVKKSDVFAHEMTEEDIKNLGDMSSREGDYSEADKKVGNFICTAKGLTDDDGKFWIVKPEKFAKNYQTKPADNETISEKFAGVELDFKHFNANGNAEFECFRIPANAPKQMTFGGQKFVPGDYVFIQDGKLDIWARAATFMDKQYTLIKLNENNKPSEEITNEYKELIQQ
jgi:hypothetical protein